MTDILEKARGEAPQRLYRNQKGSAAGRAQAMARVADYWMAVSREAAAEIKRLRGENRCDDCGARLIDGCVVCGAPVCCPMCCRISTLEAIVSALREGPGDSEERIHQTCNYPTGLHCGVEDRNLQGDAYGAADYGFTEGVDAVLEWVNGIVPAAEAATKETT